MDKLLNLIHTFYESQVLHGKVKTFKDCNYYCVPLSQVPPYLKSQGVDWRNDYNCEKLTELIQKLEGISMYIKGVPYFYIEQDSFVHNDVAVSLPQPSTPKANFTNKSFTGKPKEYEVRNAYRKLAKNAEDWVSIVSLMKEVGWTGEPSKFTETYKLQFKSANKSVRVHNISRYEILDDIYFDPDKNSFPSNVKKLRAMALDENWDENNKANKLLENYLCYTYARIKDEEKISKSSDELYACWNTGLVDYRYEPIYCYMTRKSTSNRWMFKAFCIDGEDLGKEMVNNISVMPKPAMYFAEDNLLCQPTADKLSADKDHFIREHPSRLPSDWLKEVLGDKAEWIPGETPDLYDKRVGDLLPKESTPNLNLQTRLKQTIDESLKRCQWNYKTAIPYYDPNNKKMGWFLPLCKKVSQNNSGKERISLEPFAALVVTKVKSGRFQGETIYRLSWAYRCARLVCRPDSDWLTPLFATDANLDVEE